MSETPQEKLERYLRDGGIITLPHIREAIRAVLDLVRVQYEANEEMTRLLNEERACHDCREYREMMSAKLEKAEDVLAAVEEIERLQALLIKFEAYREAWERLSKKP